MKRDNKTDGHKHDDSTVTMQSLPQKLQIFKAEVKSEVKKELTWNLEKFRKRLKNK